MAEVIFVWSLPTSDREWRTVRNLGYTFWRTTRFLFRVFTFHLVLYCKFFEVIKPHLPEVHTYADDSQLFLSFKPDNEVNESEAIISQWSCVSQRLERGCGWTNLNLIII